jgi:hypothetical protein
MRNPAIFFPVFALVAWTFAVLLLIPLVRARSALRREVAVDDFRFGESAVVPAYVSVPNRNYMNLLELPVLFYVVCLLLYLTAGVSTPVVGLAWAYVALRVVHSLIHLSYNNVLHRLTAFSLSNGALVVLWMLAAIRLSTAGAG